MKKWLIIIFIFGLIGLYLNRTYAYFYNYISQNRLYPPIHQTMIIIGNNPSSETLKYAALGDSLTEGLGVLDYKETFPYLFAQKLSSRQNVETYIFARSGDISQDVLDNQLPEALTLKPDLVTLLIGTNDIHNSTSPTEFENNLTKIISSLKETGAKIYLFTIPYLGSDKLIYPPYNTIIDSETKQFNKIIDKVAKEYQVNLIDLYSLKKPSDFYSQDNFHPSAKGYKSWAEAINVN